jgi:phosphoglycolate phosphatase
MTTTLIKQLKHYQIFEYFDDIIGLNDSYANSKERVGIEYINTLKQGHDEVLLIGDSIHDKEVADAMNVSCILVSTGHTNKERLQQSCKIVVDNLSDIKKYL